MAPQVVGPEMDPHQGTCLSDHDPGRGISDGEYSLTLFSAVVPEVILQPVGQLRAVFSEEVMNGQPERKAKVHNTVETYLGAGRLKLEKLGKILDFFRVFVDRCHHGKEEEYLFPTMEKRGIPADKGPICDGSPMSRPRVKTE